MAYAKAGIVTVEMERVLEKEAISKEELLTKIAKGEIVIPANINHKSLDPEAIGSSLRTKINVNLGVSKDNHNYSEEMKKAKLAMDLKVHSIMDLSNYGNTREFRKKLIEESPLMIGTVPMYDAVGALNKELKDITVDEFFQVVEEHAKDGVDFMTIHAGINREVAESIKSSKRLTNIVSRGGSLLFAWMHMNNKENPFYEYFDRLLDILAKYDVTLSLGDACRPGSLYDATDTSQIHELVTLGKLTKRAWEKNVQVMIEGPGHIPIDEIETNIQLGKKLCHNAPFYVLGPLVTDIGAGHDHITGAIGGAMASYFGADFLCYVTPAEHLRLPTLDDVKEGIMAFKIAAHAGDIGKKVPNARDIDDKMSFARAKVDFDEMIKLAIDNEKAMKYRKEAKPEDEHTCTMCGQMCPMKNMEKILKGEDINLL